MRSIETEYGLPESGSSWALSVGGKGQSREKARLDLHVSGLFHRERHAEEGSPRFRSLASVWKDLSTREDGAVLASNLAGWFRPTQTRYWTDMTLTDEPADPPASEPDEVPERLTPVEVPEPMVEDTPERG